jgi:MFS transporter, NHS family, xanthosine permease
VLRFGLFSFGNPTDGLWMIVLSCIVYGMAFDFFNISGSLFVESNTDAKIRSSAQGLFMMMTNGVGAILGSFTSGWIIDKFFMKSFSSTTELSTYLETEPTNKVMTEFIQQHGITVAPDGLFNSPILMKDWHHIWLSFAAYALVIAIAFAFMFKHKHDPESLENFSH